MTTAHGRRSAERMGELGAFLVVIAVLALATLILSVINRRGADDNPLNGGTQSSTSPTAS